MDGDHTVTWRVTSLAAAFSGALVAPGVMMVSSFDFVTNLMLGGIAASTLGAMLGVYSERYYQYGDDR